MARFSWHFEFTGAARTWLVSMMFCAAAVICGLILLFVLRPQVPPDSLQSEGMVVSIQVDEGMERPIFRFIDHKGVSHEFASGITSNHSAYHVGERVSVMFRSADPSAASVQDDKDLVIVIWILGILASVFGGLGLAMLGMKLKGLDDDVISRIGGLIGALAYAIPATLVLPGFWIAHSYRPNWLFEAEATFGSDDWLIGSVFTGTGLLALVGTIVLSRYQARHQRATRDGFGAGPVRATRMSSPKLRTIGVFPFCQPGLHTVPCAERRQALRLRSVRL